jgi:hypothetical protein
METDIGRTTEQIIGPTLARGGHAVLATPGFLPAILDSTNVLQSHNVQRIENRRITVLVHDHHGAGVQHDKFRMRNNEFVSAGGHKCKRLEAS